MITMDVYGARPVLSTLIFFTIAWAAINLILFLASLVVGYDAIADPTIAEISAAALAGHHFYKLNGRVARGWEKAKLIVGSIVVVYLILLTAYYVLVRLDGSSHQDIMATLNAYFVEGDPDDMIGLAILVAVLFEIFVLWFSYSVLTRVFVRYAGHKPKSA